jgi:hypothetical protein
MKREAKVTVFRTESFRDDDMVYRLPPSGRHPSSIFPNDFACKETQTTQNQTFGSPALTAQPQSTLLLLYQENGHVTRVQEDIAHLNSGTISVFGKLHSSPADTLQGLFDKVNQDSDVRLLSKRSFDDGICFQNNNTPKAQERKEVPKQRSYLEVEGEDVWCGIEVVLPSETVTSDMYTIYWIWEFDGSGFDEKYTTCIDVMILHNKLAS